MEALDIIKERKSIRAFKPNPISKEVMQKIMIAAGNSPSYTNTQPWKTVVVSGQKRIALSQELLGLIKNNITKSPDIPLPTSWPQEMENYSREHGARRLDILGIDRNDQEGRKKLSLMNFEFYGAPCAVFLFMDQSLGVWSVYDMGLFTQNLILAAYSLGIGSCIQASVTEYAGEIKKFLNIAEDQKLVACISMGYPDTEAKLNQYRSLKKALPDYLKWFE